jgi:hypothetical protein
MIRIRSYYTVLRVGTGRLLVPVVGTLVFFTVVTIIDASFGFLRRQQDRSNCDVSSLVQQRQVKCVLLL